MIPLAEITYTELITHGAGIELWRGVTKQGEHILLKQSVPDAAPSACDRLEYEYGILKQIQSSHILQPKELLKLEDKSVAVFESFSGVPLNDHLAASLPIERALAIGNQLAEGLGHLHLAGVIFLGLAPENVLFDPVTDQIKLINFFNSSTEANIAFKIPDADIFCPRHCWYSPEQTGRMDRMVDYRADLYVLGLLLYKLISGEFPFEYHDPLELLHAHLAQQPVSLHKIAAVPETLSKIVDKLLRKDPEERYQSAWGAAYDLRSCLQEMQQHAPAMGKLCSRDVPHVFRIPDILFGREKEQHILRKIYTEACQGESRIVFVKGSAGIGKTALVKTLEETVAREKGIFISGKYEQLRKEVPYSGFVHAFNQLARCLTALDNDTFENWRTHLLGNLESMGKAITDFAPEVELVLGKLPELPPTGAQEALVRFTSAFQIFLRLCCEKADPLVFFLDDLQWLDSASIDLFELIIDNLPQNHFLLIACYRDNEIDLSHPLSYLLLRWGKKSSVATIALAPLEIDNIHILLSYALHSLDVSLWELASVVKTKTQGNPLYTRQYLESIIHDRLINFDKQRLNWNWNIEQIENFEVHEELIGLFLRKIDELPSNTQNIVNLASCIGTTFDLETLALVATGPGPTKNFSPIVDTLKPALAAGLIKSADAAGSISGSGKQKKFSFAHDQIQEAVYSRLGTTLRQKTHLQIARALFQFLDKKSLEERIFEVADHFISTHSLLTDTQERLDVITVVLQAADRASTSTAYQAFWEYAHFAMELYAEKYWNSEPDLGWRCAFANIEAALAIADMELADKLLDTFLARANDQTIKAQLLSLRVQRFVIASEFPMAFEASVQVLIPLGYPPPEDLEAANLALREKINAAIKEKGVRYFLDGPPMRDPVSLLILQIIGYLAPMSAGRNQPFWMWLISLAVNLVLEHGATSAAFSSILLYFYLEAIAYNECQFYEQGVKSISTYCMSVKMDYGSFYGLMILNSFCLNKKFLPVHDNVHKKIQSFCKSCASFLLLIISEISVNTSKNFAYSWDLENSLNTIRDIKKFLLARNITIYLNGYATYELLLDRLCSDLPENKEPIESLLSYQQLEKDIEKVKDPSEQFFLKFITLFDHYMQGDFVSAQEATKRIDFEARMSVAHTIPLVWPLTIVFTCLNHAQLASSAEPIERHSHASYLEALLEKLNIYRTINRDLFTPFILLVEAERIRITSDSLEAFEHYELAMAEAKATGSMLAFALANELTAHFWMERGNREIATVYWQEAHNAYRQTRAKNKATLLEAAHPDIFPPKSVINEKDVFEPHLDMHTILKAARALSEPLELNNFMATFLNLTMQYAGATKAAFVREQGRDLVLMAIKPDGCSSDLEQNVDPRLFSIVRYVRRTNEKITVGNLAQDARFSHGSHGDAAQAKSVLCKPLVHRGEPQGFLYLENDLSLDAFTAERQAVLDILCAQAAISLVNAELFSNLRLTERQLRNYHAELLNIQERERQHISRELHDNIAQELLSLKLYCDEQKKMHPDAVAFSQLSRKLLEGVKSIRSICYDLRPPGLDQLGLANAIEQYAADFSVEHGLKVECFFAGVQSLTLPPDVSINLFRVVQEALRNALLHGEAQRIIVRMAYTYPDLILRIQDEGKGFDMDSRLPLALSDRRMGIIGMRERVELMGGSYEIESRPGKGTRIRIEIPLEEPA